ncbi:hydrolase 1, exosortase A system-associated [Janthinobacterium sp. 17J80-10]|uniref:hydrolase 1, exosortase A system-associated n=1 Tax=Janthinobacterium sp. 17J80-10 TaxID=2497863 RepID=UPI0010058B1E|nr:hydrolase 1, exosortase A system-associated [Janthinobacterium sp. 17J80-10]QAU35381.1 hydrolase 1, exosortase A system-associated [Janthinobacterium sp. 17J80-10]
MNIVERPLVFSCHGDWSYGILSLPAAPAARGVLIVVGGPQYRVGSHRQFTLLARHLAAQGIPAMRFDYRGMGDSQGNVRDFEEISDDIRAAVDAFFAESPGLQEVVIWGLCDAASAAIFYAASDSRICGLVLLNPWVRTEEGIARAYLKHYYLKRAFDPDLWKKIMQGRFDGRAAWRSLRTMLETVRRPVKQNGGEIAPWGTGHGGAPALPERMHEGLRRFNGKVLLVLSGNDMTAQEFSDLAKTSRKWQKFLRGPNVQQHQLAGANHTFSQEAWRNQVAQWTTDWIRSW